MVTVAIRNTSQLDDRYIVQNNFSRYSFGTVAQNNMINAFVNKLELEPFNEVLTVQVCMYSRISMENQKYSQLAGGKKPHLPSSGKQLFRSYFIVVCYN